MILLISLLAGLFLGRLAKPQDRGGVHLFTHMTFLNSHACLVKYVNLEDYDPTMYLHNMDSFKIILRGPWENDYVEILYDSVRYVKYLKTVRDSKSNRMITYDVLTEKPDTIIELKTKVDDLSMSIRDIILVNINGMCIVGIFPVSQLILIEYQKGEKMHCTNNEFIDTTYVCFFWGDLPLFYQEYGGRNLR